MAYITFTATNNVSLELRKSGTMTIPTLYYSKNGGDWSQYSLEDVSLSNGETVSFYGTSGTFSQDTNNYLYFSISSFNAGYVTLSGNLFSLLSDDLSITDVPNYAFYNLFKHQTCLRLGDFQFDPTSIGDYGCYFMFMGCTGLKTFPSFTRLQSIGQYGCYYMFTSSSISNKIDIPATTVGDYGCANMFEESQVAEAGEISATTVGNHAFNSTYKGCYSLKHSPKILPATTVGNFTYYRTFYGCYALEDAPEIMATTIGSGAFGGMFTNCESLKKTPSTIYATTATGSCCADMFNGCISIKSSPRICFTNVAGGCMNSMFKGCISLEKIWLDLDYNLFAVNEYTVYWVSEVETQGEFCCTTTVGTQETIKRNDSACPTNWTVNNSADYDYLSYTGGSCGFAVTGTLTNIPTISYKINNGAWTAYTMGDTITLSSGQKVYFKGNNNTFSESADNYITFFSNGGTVGGSVTSLLSENTFITAVPEYAFYRLFKDCTSEFENMDINCREVSAYCFYEMFKNCTNMESVPSFTSVTVGAYCFYGMFEGCTSLTDTFELSVLILAEECYGRMYYGCSSITDTIVLPATTLATNCYESMLYGCSNISAITVRYVGGDFFTHTTDWVHGVSATGTFKCPTSVGEQDTITRGVSACPTGWTVPVNDYLRLTFSGSGTVSVSTWSGNASKPNFEYKVNDGEWTEGDYSSISVSNGTVVGFRGNNSTWYGNKFNSSAYFTASGNLLSLLDETCTIKKIGYGALTSIFQNSKITEFNGEFGNAELSACSFNNCFSNCYYLTSCTASITNDYFPYKACAGMFSNCTALTHAPSITANIVGDNAFWDIFFKCTALTSAGDITVHKMIGSGFETAFKECTQLTTSPNLEVDIPSKNAFVCMFEGCTSLTTAPTLKWETILFQMCQKMFCGCTALVTPPEMRATKIEDSGCIDMFMGCTSLSSVPNVDITAVGSYGMKEMFKNCTSLAQPLDLPNLSSMSTYSFQNMYQDCTSLTDTAKINSSATGVNSYTFQRMYSGCTSLTRADATMFNASSYTYSYMYSGCTSLTEIVTLPLSASSSSHAHMFDGCTSLTEAKVPIYKNMYGNCLEGMYANCTGLTSVTIPRPMTYSSNCFKDMFSGCTSLSKITLGAADASVFTYTSGWVTNVAETGTFICKEAVGTNETITRGVSACPTGWTVTTPADKLEYMCFDTKVDNTCKFTAVGTATLSFEYKIDNGSWTAYTLGTDISVGANSKVYFKGDNASLSTWDNKYVRFSSSEAGNMSGDMMSLIDTSGLTTFVPSYSFYKLFYENNKCTFDGLKVTAEKARSSAFSNTFYGCTALVDASEFELPISVDTDSGTFTYMFYGCTALRKAPNLTSTTVGDYVYNRMFMGCTSLTSTPQILTTKAGSYAFDEMFRGCTSLANVVDLVATKVSSLTYEGTFYGCTALVTAPKIHATEFYGQTCKNMFNGCTALKNVPKITINKTQASSFESMFYGCTALETSPEIEISTLYGNSTLSQMFTNCSSLNHIKIKYGGDDLFSRTTNWVLGVSETGTFECNSAIGTQETIARGVSACPTGWTVTGISTLFANFKKVMTNSNVAVPSVKQIVLRGLPVGYTGLDYIESRLNGSTYINLNTTLTQANAVEVDYQLFNATGNSAIFGTSNGFSMWAIKDGTVYSEIGTEGVKIAISDTQRHTLKSDARYGIYLDGNMAGSIEGSTFTSGNVYLFGVNENDAVANTFYGKIFGVKIYGATGLSMNLIPCINNLSVVGMYDMVGNTFYGSSGAEGFVAGNQTARYELVPTFKTIIMEAEA